MALEDCSIIGCIPTGSTSPGDLWRCCWVRTNDPHGIGPVTGQRRQMISSPPPAPASTESAAADRFFSAAIPRMLRCLLVIGAIFTLLAVWRFGLITAIGFAAGSFIAYLSFRSLHKAVQALAARV